MNKTLLDEFAMATLSGLLADPGMDVPAERLAATCYDMAEAMMAERAKRMPQPLMRAVPEDPRFPDGPSVAAPEPGSPIREWQTAQDKRIAELEAERDQLANHLARVLQTYGDNSGFEPSLSVFHREIDRARDYMAKRQGGAK